MGHESCDLRQIMYKTARDSGFCCTHISYRVII
nr:MAG TPA: hypothetical protein [Caudoviricetes sp.]